MLKKFQNSIVVFDLDGTLYHTKIIDEQNIRAAISSISEYLDLSKDKAHALLIETKKKSNSEYCKATSKALDIIGVPIDIIEKNQNVYINPEKNLLEDAKLVSLVKKLKKNRKIALLTNTRKLVAERILKSLGFTLDDFDLIQTGDKLSEIKPSEREIKNCIELLNGSIEKSIMIGDRWNIDLEPAQNIGMRTALIKNRSDLIKCIENEIKGHNNA